MLCVAFLNQKGVHLLEPQLAALEGRCRVLVTSVLSTRGLLSNAELVDTLHVHRSSAVCAILAQLPEVEVESVRPITLRVARRPGWADAFLREARAEDR